MKETCIDGGTAGYSELHWLHLWDGEGCALVQQTLSFTIKHA